jgi:hypothetical protein
MNNKVTIVTGLWDLGRGDLQSWAKRDFSFYKDKFFELLQADIPMCIWIPKELEQEVLQQRGNKPTRIYFKELKDFETWFPFFDKLQTIRNNPNWYNQAAWLKDSPQAALKYYNPIMMCKMFMVNDSTIYNPFGSDYFYWIDGGITNTVGKDYFLKDNVFDKLSDYSKSIKKFVTINYPYICNSEVHGFERKALAKYCNTGFVNYVSRGGFWGGKKELINKINDLYYSALNNTINDGYMGADECLFTILTHSYPDVIHKFDIDGNGLIWPFFECIKNFIAEPIKEKITLNDNNDIEYIQSVNEIEMNEKGEGTNMYIVTFNSPDQLMLLLKTFEESNPELLPITNKFLINNSTDDRTNEEYDNISKSYNFIQIKNGNMGICGARQWAAQHFHSSNAKYILWFEDDMLLEKETKLCKNGLNMHSNDWLSKCINIVEKEEMDFLKISFSEFFGDHHKQWSWHNIPQDVRDKYFLDGTCRMKWNKSGCVGNLSYLIGEVYYSNWPCIMTRAGNYKIFLETKYSMPFEQTIMSHCYQLTKKGRIRSGVLMASLINHNRVYHYSKEIRKEC